VCNLERFKSLEMLDVSGEELLILSVEKGNKKAKTKKFMLPMLYFTSEVQR